MILKYLIKKLEILLKIKNTKSDYVAYLNGTFYRRIGPSAKILEGKELIDFIKNIKQNRKAEISGPKSAIEVTKIMTQL